MTSGSATPGAGEHYQNLILGSGEAGKYIAWTLAKAGERTAVVERGLIGGSCPNIACLPSKNIIHSAKVASLFHRAAEFGIETPSYEVHMEGVRARKRKMVDGLIQLHLSNYEKSGAGLILGEGRLVGPRTLEVRLKDGTMRRLTADRLFLNVGTHATIPEIPGLGAAKPMTHVEALELDRIPAHLIVLGGGSVGLESGQAIRRLGSRVTVIERGPQLASREDQDVGEAMLDLFRDEGIEVLLQANVVEVNGVSGQGIRVRVNQDGEERVLEGTDFLVAAGRTPNTKGIGLETAGVELDPRGYIKVNERLEATAPGVWAMGECAGSPQFTHVAFDDFRVVRDNLNGGNRTTRDRLIPSCLFTDPELGRVGLNEVQAKKAGIEYRVAKMSMEAVLRTRTLSETRGFMKMLIDKHGDRILGFTAFGAEAGELIAVVQTAMLAHLPFPSLRDTIFTHPTMAEGLTGLLANVESRAGASR
jgi:pyruvate/2-oxoglutarate dehydrogenase complex dihydrolipoamide dehydrogenase (E3) component